MINLGFFNTATTRTHVGFQFSTHAAAGANVAPLSAFEAADLRIYKAADGAAFSATQRSSANGITMTSPFDSLTGYHDVDIDLTDNTDAGFYASGCRYIVVLAPDTETIDSQTITGIPLAYFEIGVAKADVTQLLGTTWLTPGTAGTPDVNAKLAGGTAWGSGAITAGAIASDAITAAKIADGAIDRATFAAETGLQSIRSNTAAAGASGTITLDGSASATDNFYRGARIFLTGGTGVGQDRLITAYVGSTKVATITPAWATTPDNTSTFAIIPDGQVTLQAINNNAGGVSAFDRATRAICEFTVGSASTTTLIITSSISPSPTVTDQLRGRIVIFDEDTTTAALRGQATDITGSSSGGQLTVSSLTTAPASGDTGIIQ